MKSRAKTAVIAIIFLLLGNQAYASSNDLKRMMRTVYPQQLTTVSDLVQFILEGTEFQLYNGLNAPKDAREILAQKIPYQRTGVLMTRTDALLMAVGEKNSIVVDYDNKLISVTRSPIQ